MSELISRLQQSFRPDQLLIDPIERMIYEADGYLIARQIPSVVVFPESTGQVSELMQIATTHNVAVVPRGAGTSLAGGCLAIDEAVVVCLTRMQQILEIDLENRFAIVEAGVVNQQLNAALTGTGFHFAPDPSSAGASTIGGNVATNAGGPHTLKYGVTSNHVLGLEVVLPAGEVVTLGGNHSEQFDCDWPGLFVGSEGTFGLCTKATVRLTRAAPAVATRLAVFATLDDAVSTVSAIISAAIIPAALELMDQGMLRAVEQRYGHGLPTDAGAVLIIEVDGLSEVTEREITLIDRMCEQGKSVEIRKAKTPEERISLWKCRKQAFGAIGSISTSFITQDGVVPRTRLPELLREVMRISAHYDIRILNVFHAGDGNIHPILLFDERNQQQVQAVLDASREILELCIDYGGTVTGEHGIGIEKLEFMTRMFNATDLEIFREIRSAFNPQLCTGRGKLIPSA